MSENTQTNKIKLHFQFANGEVKTVEAALGETLLDLAREHDINIEGACGGVLACATCHVVVQDPWFEQLPPATEMEENMLDNAQELTLNSRLCCQLITTPELDGMIITVPKSSENVSGHHH